MREGELDKLPFTREQALELGEPYYFTGKRCKHGHHSERLAKDGRCRECIRQDNKRRNRNPEYQKQKQDLDRENRRYRGTGRTAKTGRSAGFTVKQPQLKRLLLCLLAHEGAHTAAEARKKINARYGDDIDNDDIQAYFRYFLSRGNVVQADKHHYGLRKTVDQDLAIRLPPPQ